MDESMDGGVDGERQFTLNLWARFGRSDKVSIPGYFNGQMDELMNGGMDGRIDGWTDEWIHGETSWLVCGWMNERMTCCGWMNGQTNDESMNGWIFLGGMWVGAWKDE